MAVQVKQPKKLRPLIQIMPNPDPAAIRKHSLTVSGHLTSISLEDAFWTALKALALRRGLSIPSLVSEIDARRQTANLSSAIRVYLLKAAQDNP